MTPFVTNNARVLGAIAVFAAVLAVFFGEDLVKLTNFWNGEDFSYCYLVPPLAAYFLYNSRGRLFAPLEGGTVVLGYVFLFLTMLFALAGSAGSLVTLVFISMWSAVAAALFFVFKDQRWKSLLTPIVTLAFMVPPPPLLTNLFSHKLRLISSRLSIEALHALNVPAYREGNLIDLGVQTLEVADACSGLRYFFPILLIAIVMGQLYHRRVADRLVLFALSPIVSILSNSLRITITGILVRYVSPKAAEGFYHDLAGFAVYGLAIILLVMCSVVIIKIFDRLLGKPEPATSADSGEARFDPRGVKHLVVASVLLLALIPVEAKYSTEFIIPERQTFHSFPLEIGDWTGKRIVLDKSVERGLGADDYFMASYINAKTGNSLQFLVPYYERQTIAHAAHAPASCLIGSGWFAKEKRELAPSAIRDFTVHRMVMARNEHHLISNFWFQQRGRRITDEFENKFYLFWDAITRRRTDGALVRAEMLLKPMQSVEEGQKLLDRFLADVDPLLKAYIPGENVQGELQSIETSAGGAEAPGERPLGSPSVSGGVNLNNGG